MQDFIGCCVQVGTPADIPIFSTRSFISGIEGSGQGRVSTVSAYSYEVWQPQRSTRVRIHSSVDIGQSTASLVVSHMNRRFAVENKDATVSAVVSTALRDVVGQEPITLVVQQLEPFSYVSYHVIGMDMYPTIVYGDSAFFVILSNSQDTGSKVVSSSPNRSLFQHRMPSTANGSTMLYVQRLVAKCNRVRNKSIPILLAAMEEAIVRRHHAA